MKEAIEGRDYHTLEDGSFNIVRGGSYIKKDGKLFIKGSDDGSIEASQIELAEEIDNEIQK